MGLGGGGGGGGRPKQHLPFTSGVQDAAEPQLIDHVTLQKTTLHDCFWAEREPVGAES